MYAYLLSLATNTLVALALPVLIGCLVGSIVAAVLQMVLQIEERGVSYLLRLTGVVLALSLSLQAGSYQSLLQFTERSWSDFAKSGALRGAP